MTTITAKLIKNSYEKNGLKIDKIIKAKLGDGFYVYHQFGNTKKRYKPHKIVKKTANFAIYQTQPYLIHHDFIPNDSDIGLRMAICEAKNRAGILSKFIS